MKCIIKRVMMQNNKKTNNAIIIFELNPPLLPLFKKIKILNKKITILLTK